MLVTLKSKGLMFLCFILRMYTFKEMHANKLHQCSMVSVV